MGVGIDSLNNTIFSVGEDKALKVTSLTEHKTLFGIMMHLFLQNNEKIIRLRHKSYFINSSAL